MDMALPAWRLAALVFIAFAACTLPINAVERAHADNSPARSTMRDHLAASVLRIFDSNYAALHPLLLKRTQHETCDRLRRQLHTIPPHVSADQVCKAWTRPECIHRLAISTDHIRLLRTYTALVDLQISPGGSALDMSALDALRELTMLTIFYCESADVGALTAHRHLQHLSLTARMDVERGVVDLAIFTHLTELTSLHLSHYLITHMHALTHLTALTSLFFLSDDITSIGALTGVTGLTRLNLSYNKLANVKALTHLMNLEQLDLSDNQITDSDALTRLTKLTALHLSGNEITNIGWLAHLTALSSLNLSHNCLTTIDALAALSMLSDVNLSHNQITNVAPLVDLTGLTSLDLSGNSINDIHALNFHTMLVHLRLSNAHITDTDALTHLIRLISLDLSNNEITHTGALTYLTALTDLHLSHAKLVDIDALSHLTRLTSLNLSNNDITHIHAVSHLTRLTCLNLSCNKILDIDALSHLIRLTSLNLSYNDITYIGALTHLTELTRLTFPSGHFNGFTDKTIYLEPIYLSLPRVDTTALISIDNLRGATPFQPMFYHQRIIEGERPKEALVARLKLLARVVMIRIASWIMGTFHRTQLHSARDS